MNSKKVGVVICNWNKKDDLLAALKSVFNLTYKNIEVIVVENGSSDGSADAVRKTFSDKVILIENKENLGFAEGNNIGIKKALELNCDYIYLLNNDVELQKDALSQLVDFLEANKQAGFAGSKIYYYNNPEKIWAAGSKNYSTIAIIIHIREEISEDFYEVDSLPACSLLIPKKIVKEVGLLDEKFFAYCEDVDYCLRIKAKGYKGYCITKSIIWHKVSGNTGFDNPFVLYYQCRNMPLFLKRYSKFFPLSFLSYSAQVFINYFRYIVFRNPRKAFYFLKIILKAYHDYFSGNFGKADI